MHNRVGGDGDMHNRVGGDGGMHSRVGGGGGDGGGDGGIRIHKGGGGGGSAITRISPPPPDGPAADVGDGGTHIRMGGPADGAASACDGDGQGGPSAELVAVVAAMGECVTVSAAVVPGVLWQTPLLGASAAQSDAIIGGDGAAAPAADARAGGQGHHRDAAAGAAVLEVVNFEPDDRVIAAAGESDAPVAPVQVLEDSSYVEHSLDVGGSLIAAAGEQPSVTVQSYGGMHFRVGAGAGARVDGRSGSRGAAETGPGEDLRSPMGETGPDEEFDALVVRTRGLGDGGMHIRMVGGGAPRRWGMACAAAAGLSTTRGV